MKTEEWRPIKGWEGYEVSDLGRVRSYRTTSGRLIDNPHLLAFKADYCGYCNVYLKNGPTKQKRMKVHRLVSSAFIPNPECKPQINHINGIKTDNRVENLEWCTAGENIRHSIANGLQSDFHRKPVIQLTKEGVFIKRHISTSHAGVNTNISRPDIIRVLRGIRNHAGGFKWKYA